MKVWISTNEKEDIWLSRIKPKRWIKGNPGVYFCDMEGELLSRDFMEALLEGTGKHLPNHASKDIVEVELTAK